MKKGLSIGIAVGVSIFAIIAIFLTTQQLETNEVEDVLDKELVPDTEIPEVQEKLDEVEKINLENEYSPKEREWITSGPFQIDRSKYPLNDTHYSVYLTIPFDGQKKDAFNYYLDPQISKSREICSVDDITGKWAVVFRGTDYPNLYFEITDDVVPGTDIKP